MMLFGWKDNKFKILGITFLKLKTKENICFYKLLGICIHKTSNLLSSVQFRVNQNKNFDTSSFDKELEKYAPRVRVAKRKENVKRVAYLVTELYDQGGHTKCIIDTVKILRDDYEQACFIGQIDRTKRFAPDSFAVLKKYNNVFGYNFNLYHYKNNIIKVFNDIVKFSPEILFVWMHPNDCLMTLLLGMLKKHTNIKIVYCPHASHFPNLGISYADAVLEALPTSAYITQQYRHCDKTIFVPMICKKVEDFPSFSDKDIIAKRREIGIEDNELCTMSGASSYKFFDKNNSEYFLMIKNLLERNPAVKHIILSNFDKIQQSVIDEIFANSAAKSRLIIFPLSEDYELFFKCADVFIDSFPVSSALTMIDLMRLKVPCAVKINRENAHWSFHEYQRSDYPYMFEKADDLLKGIESLLVDKAECARIIALNYQHYLTTFEGNVAKVRLCEIINNADHLERFYSGPISGNYQFKELEL